MDLSSKKQEILSQIPENYSYKYHLAENFIPSLMYFALGIFISILLQVKMIWFLMIPAFLLVAIFLEYLIHKYLLHTNLINSTFKFHQSHHLLYQSESMKVSNLRELYWILIPSQMLFDLSCVVSLFCFMLGFLTPLAWILYSSIMLFYIIYESFHTLCHLYPSKLTKHHSVHHKLSNMNKYNMGVTSPIVDIIFDTYVK